MVDCSSHRFEEVWTLPITYRHATRREPGEVAMTCGTLEVHQGKQYAKIKIHTMVSNAVTRVQALDIHSIC